jgi:hypothetical protein
MREAKNEQPEQKAAGDAVSTRKRRRSKNKVALVGKVIKKIEEKLDSDQLKPTVGDFIRLLQLEKELKEEQPKEIEVLWVEPKEKEDASDT